MIASSRTYTVDFDDCTWEVEYLSSSNNYVKVSADKGICEISLDMDFDLIGEVFKLKALSKMLNCGANINNDISTRSLGKYYPRLRVGCVENGLMPLI